MVLNVNLITGRTIDQGRAYEGSKMTDEMTRAGAIVEIDPEDMAELDILTGTVVKVKTDFGEVNVRAVKSPNAPHRGLAFIPLGLWANQVVSPDTTGIGTPSYKGLKATIEPTPGKKVLSPKEIAKSFRP
ncbi:MAG: molybdopterin dinucleotide-binding protein [Candidatus Lokiarchaeota archaeon]|nr:molybdopterin dinucleotide-binding protein [Candidatus Lokiarchaeota archaeon]